MIDKNGYIFDSEDYDAESNLCSCEENEIEHEDSCLTCLSDYGKLKIFIVDCEHEFPETEYIFTSDLEHGNFELNPFILNKQKYSILKLSDSFVTYLLNKYFNFISEMSSTNEVQYFVISSDELHRKFELY